jgi:hypothetical protein
MPALVPFDERPGPLASVRLTLKKLRSVDSESPYFRGVTPTGGLASPIFRGSPLGTW